MPVSPNQGSTGGGDAVTLTGTHFTATSGVRYGSRPAASFTVVSDTITDTVTPSGQGPVPVSVTTPGGTGVVGTFYYLGPPSFRILPPPEGPLAGGNTVILAGIGLFTTTAVLFGTQAAVFTADSDGRLTVTVPAALAAGPVAVVVRARGGTASGATYTYLAPPAITIVTPDSGPVDGGNLVVISGTAFSYATGVTFGGTPALSCRVASDTEIDALVPAGALGPANVSVTTLGGTTTAVDAYTYLGRFAVLGGQTVTNTGLTSVTGDLGVSPGVAVTGFPPGQVHGTVHVSDTDAIQAHADLVATYAAAAGRIPDAGLPADIGGLTLTPGHALEQGHPQEDLGRCLRRPGPYRGRPADRGAVVPARARREERRPGGGRPQHVARGRRAGQPPGRRLLDLRLTHRRRVPLRRGRQPHGCRAHHGTGSSTSTTDCGTLPSTTPSRTRSSRRAWPRRRSRARVRR